MTDPSLVYRTRRASGTPDGLLALLHGRGADERDLEPLLEAIDPNRRFVGVLPRGPLSLPPGGAHWYVVRQIGYPDPTTFMTSFELLSGWLDATAEELGIPPERIVLGGFSQGAVMSYALGLAADRPPPAGILAMSGFIPRVDGFDLDPHARAGLPVSISHGANDPVIGVQWGRDARDRLSRAGLAVRYREDPVGHTVSAGALAQVRATLDKLLR